MRDINDKNGQGRKIPIKEGPAIEEEGREETMGEAVAPAPPVDEAAALKAELEKTMAELAQYQDKYLRLYAETDNFKKRMNREVAEREKYYNENIIKDLLPVLDNLERALSHAGEDMRDDGLVAGVRMVRKQFMDVLQKYGVKQVESVGLPFDPEKQQAMMQVETDQYEEGTVVEEFQKGYFLGDRILRPAMVTVAKRPADKPRE